METQPEWERARHGETSILRNWSQFFIFHGLLLYTEMLYKSHVGSAVLTFIKVRCFIQKYSPGCSLEGLMLKLKLPILWPPDVKSWLTGKDPDAGKDWGQEEKGKTEDEMVGRHHWLDGHGFEWTLGTGDGQGGLVCCGSWGHKELDTTEQLNWTQILLPELRRYHLCLHLSNKYPNHVYPTKLYSFGQLLGYFLSPTKAGPATFPLKSPSPLLWCDVITGR